MTRILRKLDKMYIFHKLSIRFNSCDKNKKDNKPGFESQLVIKKAEQTMECLYHEVSPIVRTTPDKVTIIGAGNVGIACVACLLMEGITKNICLIDINKNKLNGELLDFAHGAVFVESSQIYGSEDYAVSAGSHIVIVTAGANQKPGETRLQLVKKNYEVLKSIVPLVMKYSPKCIMMVVTNPCDVLSLGCKKLADIAPAKLFSSGTNLDTSRFRLLIARKLKIAAESVNAMIIGEHGDSSVPVWSAAQVGGVNLKRLYPKLGSPDDPDEWWKVHNYVVKSAYEIISLKGYTSWAVAMSCANICETIIGNLLRVHPVGINVKDLFCLKNDVFVSMPCVLGHEGVVHILKIPLDEKEQEKLEQSIKIVDKTGQDMIK